MYENMIVIDRQARESLQMQIRRQLAIGIVSRQFPLNEPLPSIRRLASDLKVSVTTVALAYRSLRADGFVMSRKRSGYFVNPDVLADPGHRAEVDGPPADTSSTWAACRSRCCRDCGWATRSRTGSSFVRRGHCVTTC